MSEENSRQAAPATSQDAPTESAETPSEVLQDELEPLPDTLDEDTIHALPHAEFVEEVEEPAAPVRETTVAIPLGEIEMGARLFPPVAATGDDDTAIEGKYPALVILHDLFGVDDWTQKSARLLSQAGYVALVPNLFARSGGPPDTSSEAAVRNFTLTLSDSQLMADALAAVSWLTGQENVDTNRLGIIGWGWGGAYALMASAHDPRLSATIDVGGTISYSVLTAQQPGSPLNFIASIEGALLAAFPGDDPLIPANEIGRLLGQMKDHEIKGEVKTYESAPPRFWLQEDSPQARLLWRRILQFLDEAFSPEAASDDVASPDLVEPMGDPNAESRLHASAAISK